MGASNITGQALQGDKDDAGSKPSNVVPRNGVPEDWSARQKGQWAAKGACEGKGQWSQGWWVPDPAQLKPQTSAATTALSKALNIQVQKGRTSKPARTDKADMSLLDWRDPRQEATPPVLGLGLPLPE